MSTCANVHFVTATTSSCTPKTPNRHPCSVEHLSTVTQYRAWRAGWEAQYDAGPARHGDDSPEALAFRERHPAPTFKAWLTQMSDRYEG
jgi:hypothetical protein